MPLQTASKTDLIAKYNQLAQSITAVNAGVTMQFTAEAQYTGVIKQYHQVNGFILAQKPADVRVIGQLPVVGTNIFNMASDGKTFEVFIPSKNQFLTGSTAMQKPSDKMVDNLRPQHLTQAIFWQPIPEADPVLFEQATDDGVNDYVLTVTTRGAGGPEDLKLTRKISFERAGLTLARMESYGDDGQLESDVHYEGWAPFGDVQYPRQIKLERPVDGYTLTINVTKLTPNQEAQASSFVLQQPAGTELVRVGEETGGGQQ